MARFFLAGAIAVTLVWPSAAVAQRTSKLRRVRSPSTARTSKVRSPRASTGDVLKLRRGVLRRARFVRTGDRGSYVADKKGVRLSAHYDVLEPGLGGRYLVGKREGKLALVSVANGQELSAGNRYDALVVAASVAKIRRLGRIAGEPGDHGLHVRPVIAARVGQNWIALDVASGKALPGDVRVISRESQPSTHEMPVDAKYLVLPSKDYRSWKSRGLGGSTAAKLSWQTVPLDSVPKNASGVIFDLPGATVATTESR